MKRNRFITMLVTVLMVFAMMPMTAGTVYSDFFGSTAIAASAGEVTSFEFQYNPFAEQNSKYNFSVTVIPRDAANPSLDVIVDDSEKLNIYYSNYYGNGRTYFEGDVGSKAGQCLITIRSRDSGREGCLALLIKEKTPNALCDDTYIYGLLPGEEYLINDVHYTAGTGENSGKIAIDPAWRGNTVRIVKVFPDENLDLCNSYPQILEIGTAHDPTTEMGDDGTPLDKGASIEAADVAIVSSASEEGPAGSVYAGLQAKASKTAKSSIKLTWRKPAGAKKFVIYANKCGKGKKYKKLAETTKTSYTVKKAAGSKLRKGTYYKFLIVAVDGSNKVVSTSKAIHAATSGGKAGNPTRVTTKARKNKVTVKVGKTFKLAAKQSGKGVRKHRAIKYETTNKAVATVSAKGVIKGKKKGTCYVYAYCQNGLTRRIRVTVK